MRLLLMILFVVVLIGVPLFEFLITNKIKKQKTPYLLNKHIEIHYEKNTGMMLGLSKNNRAIVLIITTILLILVLGTTIFLIFFTRGMITLKIGCIVLSGGAMSNALERYIYKHVIDYISFPKFLIKKVRRIIFNVADFFIFIGCLIILIGVILI